MTRRLGTAMRNVALIILAFLFFPGSLPAQGVITEINESTKLLYEGGTQPLTTTPVVGTPKRQYSSTFKPGTEALAPGELRVTILDSGDPLVKSGQASASVLIEVGNKEHDFFFDPGSGAVAHFNGLKLPVTCISADPPLGRM